MPVRKNQSEFQNTTFLLVEIQILISFFTLWHDKKWDL